MKITVFGATGQVGKQIVKLALWKGYKVVAFGRNVFDMEEHENLELFKGALFDEAAVYESIKESDAVLSAIGGAFDGTDKARSLGIKNIITQMEKAGLKRIIALGGLGILNAEDGTLLIDAPSYPAEFIPVGNEHRKAYEYLNESGLDWTFVCSPNIINEDPTGAYITRKDYPPEPNQYKINAGDLAQFMLNELKKREYVRVRVGISQI
ncbi:MAG: NAD(P)H-binding protein [Chitinophagaceae bacterium]